jgi:hypothetical protein
LRLTVKTDSDAAAIPGPVYLDASAWVKLYNQERHSLASRASCA